MEVERVQAIASLAANRDTIPAEFIRSEHERPDITTYRGPAANIPVVDLSDPDRANVVKCISDAAQEWGIFQVVNHGIPVEVIKELQRVGKEFFELPVEEKEAYATQPGSIEGYGTKLQKDLEMKKAWVDHLFHNIWPQSRINYRFWPVNPPDYRYACSAKLLA